MRRKDVQMGVLGGALRGVASDCDSSITVRGHAHIFNQSVDVIKHSSFTESDFLEKNKKIVTSNII